jgi:replicative DNA helicase
VRVDDLRGRTLDDPKHAAVAAAALALKRTSPVLDQLSDAGVAGVSDFLVDHLGLELAIVDPMQFLAGGGRPLDEELASVARALKELAIRRSAAILAVAHLGRELRGRSNPRPTLEDFGGQGMIRQQADIVLGLYREELYAASPHVEGAAELHVLKNRNGPLGFVDLYFYKQWMRFEDVVEPDER